MWHTEKSFSEHIAKKTYDVFIILKTSIACDANHKELDFRLANESS